MPITSKFLSLVFPSLSYSHVSTDVFGFSTGRSNSHVVSGESTVEFLIPAPHAYPTPALCSCFSRTRHPPSYLGPEPGSQLHAPRPCMSCLLLPLSAGHVASISGLVQTLPCSRAAAPAPHPDCQDGLVTARSSFSVSSLAVSSPQQLRVV